MKRLITLAVLFVVGASIATEVPYEAVTKEEGVYLLELAGIGFAFSNQDTLKKPETFMIKVISRVQELESMSTPEGDLPVHQKVLVKPSTIRVGYTTYPLDVVELSSTYIEANVYSGKVTELGELVAEERIGKLQVLLAIFTGLPGGKGTLMLGEKSYSIFFYQPEALDGFYRWAPEFE
jgi:hypothetical protein